MFEIIPMYCRKYNAIDIISHSISIFHDFVIYDHYLLNEFLELAFSSTAGAVITRN